MKLREGRGKNEGREREDRVGAELSEISGSDSGSGSIDRSYRDT
jgi:hypothetical protein